MMGKILIAAGCLLIAIGVLWLYFPRALSWFGNLPGDIHIKREGFTLFIPLTSMLLTSVLMTLLLNGIARVLHLFAR